ncbi:MAG TPA: SDR family oxidoreductase [Acidimicrobiales bacterium]|nr:SDR family oxidoreductase [Acidimicrobiales bacterium]
MPLALVTGASSGIGHAFARCLAAAGHDLVVVARDRARLEALAASSPSVDVEVLVADLASAEGQASVEARLASDERPVDLLVNNAGFGTTGRFWELPVDEEAREIAVNVIALTRLTAAALPAMVARRAGGVINVASIAAFSPTPGTATYGATKAYVLSFTQALREELRGTGVRALALCPGLTRTEFQERAGYEARGVGSRLWQSADEVAATALAALERDAGVCTPGLQNKAAAVAGSLVPRRLQARLAGFISGQV